MKLIAVPVIATLSLCALADAGDSGAGLQKELKGLIASLRTEELKIKARLAAQVLTEENDDLEKAVLFFYDLKAKGVLLAILRSDDRYARAIVARDCLDLFGVEDLVGLYEGARANAPFTLLRSGSIWLEHTVNMHIASRTTTMLGLKDFEPRAPNDMSENDFQAWWRAVLRAARAKGMSPSSLDAALKYLEKAEKKK